MSIVRPKPTRPLMHYESSDELPQVGTQWLLTAMGKTVYVVTELKPGALFPVGVARLGQTKTELFVRPIALQPITLLGHTNN